MQTERALAAVKAKRQKNLVVPRNGAAAGLFFLLVGLLHVLYVLYFEGTGRSILCTSSLAFSSCTYGKLEATIYV